MLYSGRLDQYLTFNPNVFCMMIKSENFHFYMYKFLYQIVEFLMKNKNSF